MSWGKYRKVENFFSSIEKEITKIDKNGNEKVATKSFKIVQDLQQLLYQMLIIMLQKEFAELNACLIEYESVQNNLKKI